MSSRFVVERIEARILDIPTIRPHKLAFGAINRQSPVVVQLWLRNGACGFGEAATIGGPSWNEESPESIRHAIEAYLAPCLLGQDGAAFGHALARMDTFCRGNAFAKSAVEMALIDAVSRTLHCRPTNCWGANATPACPWPGPWPAAMCARTWKKPNCAWSNGATASSR